MCMPTSNQKNLHTCPHHEAHKRIPKHMRLGSSRLLDLHLQRKRKIEPRHIEFSLPQPESDIECG